MYLVVIAWLYVVLMMAVAEAFSSQGSLLGAIITFVLYGMLPLSIVVYILNTPQRKARRQAEQAGDNGPQASMVEPDTGHHTPRGTEDAAVATVRKEP